MFFCLAPEHFQTAPRFFCLWENTSMPLNFIAWICVRITSLVQNNYSVVYFEACFQTKVEWCVTLWTASGQRRAVFLKRHHSLLSSSFPLHFLEKQSQSHTCFQLTLPSWFLLAEAENLPVVGKRQENNGGASFLSLSQFLSFQSGIIIVHDIFVFFTSHRIRLEICVHLQFPKFLLNCATGHEAFITLLAFSGFCSPICMCSRFTKTPLLEVGSLKILSYHSV